MFLYDKKLQYPVKIDRPNPRLASIIISQYGGPDGELGASLRYLSQRFSMPYPELKGLLTDVGMSETKVSFLVFSAYFSHFFIDSMAYFHLFGNKLSFTSMVLSLCINI